MHTPHARSDARPPTRLAAGLPLACLLLLVWGGAPRVARADPPRQGVPEARPVQLDGRPIKAEWSAALTLPFSKGGSVLRLQQYRGTLLLALESDRTWTPGSTLALFFCPAGPKAGAEGPGCTRIDYEPFQHNRAHASVRRKEADGWRSITDVLVVRRDLRPGATRLEMALPLSALGLTSTTRGPLRACVQWALAGGSMTWPAGLEFRAPAGTMPPDYASAEHWAWLEGLGDPAGAGAFSRATWDAWLAEDRQIREAGATAHETVNLLSEEWKKTKKRDKEVMPAVFGNFRAVREHERLTAKDQLAMVMALRFLNRHDMALGMLESLVDHPDRAAAFRAYRERALVYEALQRFDDAIADWQTLAKRTVPPWRAAYERAVTIDRGYAKDWAKEEAARKAVEGDATAPRVLLHTTHGPIRIVLHAHDTPVAVKHFLKLVSTGFYDGTLFHRVQGNFLAQGGDPTSRDLGLEQAGRGTSPQEVRLEVSNRHTFWRGAVGFAHGMREMNGSQFFLMTAPNPDLGKYTCFGHIEEGQRIADRLEVGDVLRSAEVVPQATPPESPKKAPKKAGDAPNPNTPKK